MGMPVRAVRNHRVVRPDRLKDAAGLSRMGVVGDVTAGLRQAGMIPSAGDPVAAVEYDGATGARYAMARLLAHAVRRVAQRRG